MTKRIRCLVCGEATDAPTCRACGAELVGAAEAAAAEQTLSDRDQTESDRDQTWSDHDQSSSDRDQRTSDEDQHASDEDFAAGGDSAAHDRSALARKRSSQDRESVAELRDEAALERLHTADARDQEADRRDRGAEARDALARLHDDQADADLSVDAIVARAERDRARAAADRVKAANDRARAAADREEAARERAEAIRQRDESADNLRRATTDELTGARTRTFGLEEASRELARAKRMGVALTLAFIDVDGLKQVNDTEGHLAGDALLHLVGETLRANFRPYDLIVRYGGDELVCVMPNLDASEARSRLGAIAAELKAINPDHSITFGIAQADPVDSLQDLLARADADFLLARSLRPGG